MNGLTISKLSSGALQLEVDEEGKEELREIISKATHLDHDVVAEMLAQDAANGRFFPINPETTFIGLTDAPCITDEMDFTNEATSPTVVGNLWWYPNYQISSFAEVLLEKGVVTFDLGQPKNIPKTGLKTGV